MYKIPWIISRFGVLEKWTMKYSDLRKYVIENPNLQNFIVIVKFQSCHTQGMKFFM